MEGYTGRKKDSWVEIIGTEEHDTKEFRFLRENGKVWENVYFEEKGNFKGFEKDKKETEEQLLKRLEERQLKKEKISFQELDNFDKATEKLLKDFEERNKLKIKGFHRIMTTTKGEIKERSLAFFEIVI
jgi:hypothetical protein